ncbi:hypothetical protein HRI_004394900 [Hibiscus trionum]|uniref:Ubiquitin-like domain-containing protein n=1 Tax=Hibiscus trionum TaxID=183268 RepID=A0A9W7MNS7_HIBTR|nr:hypothetical protein HRI_004394900 [Hibiscus trionum]
MGSSGSDKAPIDTEMEDSEATIEIKIKTLDSQTYTLRVDKQMPVPALKEQIASATGVLSEQQRLICRGAVLKDDQLLSAYHVEDGHTLHLVVRQPVPPSSDGSPNHSANNHASGTGRGHSNHVPVSIETFNVSDQGDGVLLEISRIVSTILGSLGLSNMALASDSTTSDARVIPDSLATLSQYLSQIRNEFDALGRAGINDSRTASMSRTGYRDSNSASNSETVREGLPTPASLAEVLLSTRQLLTEQAGESLQQLARQVEGQGNVTDPSARLLVQSNALRTGALLNNLGSFLLELGRTTMTLRLGQTASEAVVNAGPAVFISPSGPIPLMARPGSGLGTGFLLPRRIDIQIRGAFISPSGPIPLMAQAPPFQPGASTVQPGSGLGTGFLLPRRIGIQIRGETPDIAREEHPPNQSGQSNQSASFAGESGVRVVPIRTMVAAVPAPLGGLPSESSGENPSPGAQPEQLPIPESAVQRQSSEESARDGSLPNANSRQQERPNTRSVNISIQESGRTQNNHQDSERQIGSSILQLQRTIYPGGEIQVEEASSQGTTTDSVRGQVETSNGAPAFEPNTADQGAFLSNLLHQIMPYISQHVGLQQSTAEEATTSTSAGNSSTRNSRRPSDSEPDPAKRQKME